MIDCGVGLLNPPQKVTGVYGRVEHDSTLLGKLYDTHYENTSGVLTSSTAHTFLSKVQRNMESEGIV